VSPTAQDSPHVLYLCLQVTNEGQASYAHVHEIIDGLRDEGMRVDLFEPEYVSASPGAFSRLREFLRTQRRLAERLTEADLVYCRAHFADFPTALRARRAGLPVVQEVNGPYEDLFVAWPWTRRASGIFTWLMRTQYRWANELVTVTDGLARWLTEETGQADVHVIPNGANVEIFRPDAPHRSGLPARYAVFFGALAAWQGIEVALKAVALPEWPEGVSLVIAGAGACQTAVEAAAAHDPRVVYLGTLPYREIPGLVAGALCGLSPQTASGRSMSGLSPLKVYETLACATPVIVTDFPGQAELVRDNHVGAVVPPEDPASLALAVRELAANETERAQAGARGRDLVVNAHSWRARARATAVVVRKAIANA